MKRQRYYRRGNLRRRRARRGNYYFRQHREQMSYNKLLASKQTLKKIINADISIYTLNGYYSFSAASPTTTAYANYFDSEEFTQCAALYQQFRVIGVRFNIYRVGQPVLITRENTNHEWGLLGLRVNMTMANQAEEDTEASDNTFWVSYLGEWMTYSKFVSFNTRLGNSNLTEWSPITSKAKQVYLSLATKGNVGVPDGYKIYLISMQYMIEFGNPN